MPPTPVPGCRWSEESPVGIGQANRLPGGSRQIGCAGRGPDHYRPKCPFGKMFAPGAWVAAVGSGGGASRWRGCRSGVRSKSSGRHTASPCWRTLAARGHRRNIPVHRLPAGWVDRLGSSSNGLGTGARWVAAEREGGDQGTSLQAIAPWILDLREKTDPNNSGFGPAQIGLRRCALV
jgi:hypothetical protein